MLRSSIVNEQNSTFTSCRVLVSGGAVSSVEQAVLSRLLGMPSVLKLCGQRMLDDGSPATICWENVRNPDV